MFTILKKKELAPKPPKAKQPRYVYKPYENSVAYRVEFRDGLRLVYPGWSKSFIFKIEEDKIYRAGEDQPSYIIIEKGIYDAAGEKLIYKLSSDAVYSPGSREAAFHISDSIRVQGTL